MPDVALISSSDLEVEDTQFRNKEANNSLENKRLEESHYSSNSNDAIEKNLVKNASSNSYGKPKGSMESSRVLKQKSQSTVMNGPVQNEVVDRETDENSNYSGINSLRKQTNATADSNSKEIHSSHQSPVEATGVVNRYTYTKNWGEISFTLRKKLRQRLSVLKENDDTSGDDDRGFESKAHPVPCKISQTPCELSRAQSEDTSLLSSAAVSSVRCRRAAIKSLLEHAESSFSTSSTAASVLATKSNMNDLSSQSRVKAVANRLNNNGTAFVGVPLVSSPTQASITSLPSRYNTINNDSTQSSKRRNRGIHTSDISSSPVLGESSFCSLASFIQRSVTPEISSAVKNGSVTPNTWKKEISEQRKSTDCNHLNSLKNLFHNSNNGNVGSKPRIDPDLSVPTGRKEKTEEVSIGVETNNRSTYPEDETGNYNGSDKDGSFDDSSINKSVTCDKPHSQNELALYNDNNDTGNGENLHSEVGKTTQEEPNGIFKPHEKHHKKSVSISVSPEKSRKDSIDKLQKVRSTSYIAEGSKSMCVDYNALLNQKSVYTSPHFLSGVKRSKKAQFGKGDWMNTGDIGSLPNLLDSDSATENSNDDSLKFINSKSLCNLSKIQSQALSAKRLSKGAIPKRRHWRQLPDAHVVKFPKNRANRSSESTSLESIDNIRPSDIREHRFRSLDTSVQPVDNLNVNKSAPSKVTCDSIDLDLEINHEGDSKRSNESLSLDGVPDGRSDQQDRSCSGNAIGSELSDEMRSKPVPESQFANCPIKVNSGSRLDEKHHQCENPSKFGTYKSTGTASRVDDITSNTGQSTASSVVARVFGDESAKHTLIVYRVRRTSLESLRYRIPEIRDLILTRFREKELLGTGSNSAITAGNNDADSDASGGSPASDAHITGAVTSSDWLTRDVTEPVDRQVASPVGGPQSPVSPTLVDDGKHSLLQFAMLHFRDADEKYNMLRSDEGETAGSSVKHDTKHKKSKKKSKTDWTWREQVEMVKWTSEPLSASLLKLESAEMNRLALDCFGAVQRYMGEQAMPQGTSEVDCVYAILMSCHRYPTLCDEVYCQLMRQTTSNRSQHADSCQRGWRLLGIVAAYFTCSDQLRPYLFKYLETAAYDKRRAYHGTALVCLHNLRKTVRYGGRKNVPSVEEITAVTAGRNSKRQLYRLPGGTERVINTKSCSVVQDIIEEICEAINITNAEEVNEYSLYCIVEGDTFTMPLAREEYILDVTTELQKNDQIFYLIFCRSVWFFPLRLDSQLYVEVVFNQITPDYLEGLLLVMPGETLQEQTVYDISRVAALLHRAADMETVPSMKETKYLLPKAALMVRDIKPPQWVNMVQSSWSEVQHHTGMQSKTAVLEILQNWPLFGSSFFAVSRMIDNRDAVEHILALNRAGVHFLDTITHETLAKYPFSEVISTRKVKTEDGTLFLDMKCGNLMMQKVVRIQSDNAHEISRLIRQYISIEQRQRSSLVDTAAVIADSSREGQASR